MTVSRPLDNFPIVRTSNAEEARAAFAQVYAKPLLTPATGMVKLSLNEIRLRHVRFAYTAFGAPILLDFPAVDGCFLQVLATRGKGEIVSRQIPISITAGTTVTISPYAGFKAAYDGDYECIALKIDSEALTKKLIAMTGATINEPLRMEPQIRGERPAAQILQEYLPLLVGTLSETKPPFPDWWILQTEQLLMAMFLFGHHHNYSYLLEQDAPAAAAPSHVRRAEEYIEANWQGGVTVEDLAEVTGVTAFSLYRAFKKSRGYSPLDFPGAGADSSQRRELTDTATGQDISQRGGRAAMSSSISTTIRKAWRRRMPGCLRC